MRHASPRNRHVRRPGCRASFGSASSRAAQAWPERTAPGRPGTIEAHRRCRVTVWFTVKLDDRPGSLARVATALGERGVNITGIVGVAEDTDGALMLTTSDAAATREAF
ncbi:MAG: ACT domain-containing protein, partial [Chloroflexota bacterium]